MINVLQSTNQSISQAESIPESQKDVLNEHSGLAPRLKGSRALWEGWGGDQ